MQACPAQACLEVSEAHVFLRTVGFAVRRLRHRSAAVVLAAPVTLLEISHPNLVRIFAIDVASGDICMEAMQLSLQAHRPPGPFHAKLHIVRAIARGLRHLHSRGMEHGDLCPANVLLARAHAHGEVAVKL